MELTFYRDSDPPLKVIRRSSGIRTHWASARVVTIDVPLEDVYRVNVAMIPRPAEK